MQSEMMKRASELLADGTVVRVLGWKNGEFVYDPTPAVFDSAEALEKDFVYHDFCGSNLSKYLIKLSKLEGKTLVFLKPCDSYGFNQLLTETSPYMVSAFTVSPSVVMPRMPSAPASRTLSGSSLPSQGTPMM